jgi:hypothetical protein
MAIMPALFKNEVVDDIKPAEKSVEDCPQDGMICIPGKGDRNDYAQAKSGSAPAISAHR